jgi:hypothetical protein
VREGAHIFRVHDVAAAADFLAVSMALSGEQPPADELTLSEELRHDRLEPVQASTEEPGRQRPRVGRPRR